MLVTASGRPFDMFDVGADVRIPRASPYTHPGVARVSPNTGYLRALGWCEGRSLIGQGEYKIRPYGPYGQGRCGFRCLS